MKRITYVNLILGIWLIVAPFVFGGFATNQTAAVNDIAIGVLLIASSWWIVAATTAQLAVSSFQLLCGIWLILAPFVLEYGGFAPGAQNDLIVGVVVAITGALETWTLWRAPLKAVH